MLKSPDFCSYKTQLNLVPFCFWANFLQFCATFFLHFMGKTNTKLEFLYIAM